MSKKQIDKKVLYELFVVEQLTMSAIARELNVTNRFVKKKLLEYGYFEKRKPLRDEYGRFIYKGQELPPNIGIYHGMFDKGQRSYRNIAARHHAKICFHCHGKDDLQVHHLDRNRLNNHFSNLRWVCRGCHLRVEHHDVLLRRDALGRFKRKDT